MLLGLFTYCVLEKEIPKLQRREREFFYFIFYEQGAEGGSVFVCFFLPWLALPCAQDITEWYWWRWKQKQTRRSGYLCQQASTRLKATCSIWNVLVQSTKRTKKIMESLPNLTLPVSNACTRKHTEIQPNVSHVPSNCPWLRHWNLASSCALIRRNKSIAQTNKQNNECFSITSSWPRCTDFTFWCKLAILQAPSDISKLSLCWEF